MTFSTSLTGLSASQQELNALSNNIANVGTTGFKRSGVEFADIVTRSATQSPRTVVGVGVATAKVRQDFSQGGYQHSNNSLDMSIGGEGFFLVKGDGEQLGSLALTRNGAFTYDADRWVTDSQGRKLQVLPTASDGALLSTSQAALRGLQLPETSGAPVPTGAVQLAVNLPTGASAPASPFDPTDPTSYNDAASVTVYGADGTASLATVYYSFVQADPITGDKEWEANLVVNGAVIGTPETLTFDSSGNMLAPAGPISYPNFDLDFGNTTTNAASFEVLFADQDGYQPGRLEAVEVTPDGIVWTTFSNGERIANGRVALGSVTNPLGMKEIGFSSWQVTGSSGDLKIMQAGEDGIGTVMGGSLERSNVDLTEELVGLISAQRNFQANARAIDTASALLQTIVQLRS